MFRSAWERTNEMTINVGDIAGYDKQWIMKQLDAEVMMGFLKKANGVNHVLFSNLNI